MFRSGTVLRDELACCDVRRYQGYGQTADASGYGQGAADASSYGNYTSGYGTTTSTGYGQDAAAASAAYSGYGATAATGASAGYGSQVHHFFNCPNIHNFLMHFLAEENM